MHCNLQQSDVRHITWPAPSPLPSFGHMSTILRGKTPKSISIFLFLLTKQEMKHFFLFLSGSQMLLT